MNYSHTTQLAFDANGNVLDLPVSAVIKGCWQLSGGHHGDKSSDRTAGNNAVDDFEVFRTAGINTFDTVWFSLPSTYMELFSML